MRIYKILIDEKFAGKVAAASCASALRIAIEKYFQFSQGLDVMELSINIRVVLEA